MILFLIGKNRSYMNSIIPSKTYVQTQISQNICAIREGNNFIKMKQTEFILKNIQ
ncbi:hypothetical protein pb186bvf_016261 [Paramecium bursaria]